MKLRRLWGIASLIVGLGLVTGCDGDDATSVVAPLTPAATSTQTATETAPVATSTGTSTRTPPPVVNTPTSTFTSTSSPAPDTPTTGPEVDTPTPTSTGGENTVTMTPTATETATPAGGALGVRQLTVMRPGSSLNTSALAGFDISLDPWLGATLTLEAGTPDGSGVAPLVLAQDVIIGVKALDNSIACFKFFAEGSEGTVSCNGNVPQSVVVTQDSNEDQNPGPLMTLTGQGDDSPAGSASLTLTRSSINLPPGNEVSDCNSAAFTVIEPAAFTTAVGTATVFHAVQSGATISIEQTGIPFDCADWTNPGGPGKLVNPIIGLDVEPAGDVANTLVLAGQQEQ